MTRGLISRGDLLEAIIRHEGKLPVEAAKSLGFLRRRDDDNDKEPKKPLVVDSDKDELQPINIKEFRSSPELEPVPFWQPVAFVRDELASVELVRDPTAFAEPPTRTPAAPPSYSYLATFNDLVPRLRSALSKYRSSRAYDILRIVDRVSRGESLRRLPCLLRPGWGQAFTS